MKLKGVNPVEQHIEKIVLVAVSAIFLLVVAAQFLYEPNKVKVGSGPAVPPGKAFQAADDKARLLKQSMDAADIPDLPATENTDLVGQFRKAFTAPVAPKATYAFGAGSVIKGNAEKHVLPGNMAVTPLSLPAPARVAAACFRSTIDPTEPANTPELRQLLPAEQPMDKAAVSVAAHIDGTALKTILFAAPKDDKSIAIPPTWIRDGIELMAVRLERQERVQGTAGSEGSAGGDAGWSNPIDVPPAPGHTDMIEQLKSVSSTGDMDGMLAYARTAAEDLQRPAYYHTIAGPAWAVPGDIAAAAAKNPEAERRVREIAEKTKKIEDLNKTVEEVTRLPVRDTRSAGQNTGSGGSGKGAGGSSGPQQQGNQPSGITDADRKARLKSLDTSIQRLTKEKEVAEKVLKDLNLDPSGKPLAPDQLQTAGQPGQPQAPKTFLETPDIQVWAHDLTAQPGKTYRYRVKVAINNPVFGRSASLVAEQQDMAKSPVVYSAPSEWSDPVQVLDDKYYFITSASEADTLGPAHATAELYEFFYGYYRRGSANLEPGDPLMAAKLQLPADLNKLPIYDLSKAVQPGQSNQPVPPAVPVSPGVRPGAMPPATSGRGQAPTGKGGAIGPGRDERAVPGVGQPQVEAAKVLLPDNARPWSKPLSLALDVYFLDVVRSPGAGASGSQAYLRDESGRITVRTPEEEKSLELYKRVVASAKEGENQGQAATLANPKDPNGGKPQTGKGVPTPPPPPGGGGGG